VLNLRLKDVKPDEGIFYLNDDDGDLKGANGKRPLLGAGKAVREWKRQHPTGDPDDYLITHKHKQTNRDGDDLATSSTRVPFTASYNGSGTPPGSTSP
jgi:hypothetical protein